MYLKRILSTLCHHLLKWCSSVDHWQAGQQPMPIVDLGSGLCCEAHLDGCFSHDLRLWHSTGALGTRREGWRWRLTCRLHLVKRFSAGKAPLLWFRLLCDEGMILLQVRWTAGRRRRC